jgi:hypothetical protein
VKGTKTSAEEIATLYEGLRQSNLGNFDVLLTGYVPSAEAVQAIGKIGRDIKFNAGTKPGSFFWGEQYFEANATRSPNGGQCLTQSWATMASCTSQRTKFPSTRHCYARRTSSYQTSSKPSEFLEAYRG